MHNSLRKLTFAKNKFMLNFTDIWKVAVYLFPVIDILGNLPIILTLTKKHGRINSEQSALVASILMISFLFAGEMILNFMEIPIQAFAVGGAFILFILAVEMLLGVDFHKTEIPESVSIVPIAFPLLAGPGVLTTILSVGTVFSKVNIILAIIFNMVIVYIVMKFAKPIGDKIGKMGIIIVHKISGVILLALAIKLFAENWKILLK